MQDQIRWVCDERAICNYTLVQSQGGISGDNRFVNPQRQMKACYAYCNYFISWLPGL